MPELIDFDSKSDNPRSIVEDDSSRFVNKIIVITGAGGMLGREGCIFFCKRGARVAALDQDKAGLKETFLALQTELGHEDFDFKTYACDVTDAQQVAETVDSIVERFGRIDCLWNNAGYQGKIQQLLDYDVVDFERVMKINVTGMFIVLQACARHMAKNADGARYSIVNTSSVAGMRGTPAMVAYASSKAAVLSMTICASKELAPNNIRVNAVSPALIGPGMMWDRQNRLHAESGSPYFDSDPEKVGQAKINGVPLKRLGTVEEVVNVVAFLLSDDSSYMTGSNLVVDGGMAGGLRA
ncbi:hypothetical protein MPSEU_001021600 [Mayamaea pseudoterrestris]|nr:hypothetical protein MPSEU_001021600 [Mayamaea pseudoterrestris]